jgi:hypothetical protein
MLRYNNFMPRRTAPPRPPAVPPHSAQEGAARITAAVVSIFDNRDGHGADWRLLVESMFQAAFVMLDNLPEESRQSVARRVHEGSYNRTLPGPLQNDSDPIKTAAEMMVSDLANVTVIKSKGPRPPH